VWVDTRALECVARCFDGHSNHIFIQTGTAFSITGKPSSPALKCARFPWLAGGSAAHKHIAMIPTGAPAAAASFLYRVDVRVHSSFLFTPLAQDFLCTFYSNVILSDELLSEALDL
jgi:hypothetical protein